MPVTYATQPSGSGQTLVYDGSAATVGLRFSSDSQWQYFADVGLTTGIAWKSLTSASPWYFTYRSYDLTGGSGNDIFAIYNEYGYPAYQQAPFFGVGNDTIRGGAGDDVVYGTAAGRDVLDGGTGSDTLYWSWATTDPLTLRMADAVQDVGGTSFTGFERYSLTLGSGNDTLSFLGMGAAVAGSFATGAGDDVIQVDHTTIGAISVDMGAGTDTLIANFSQSSRVWLSEAARTPGYAHSDIVYGLATPEGVSLELTTMLEYYSPYLNPTGFDRAMPENLWLTLSPGNDNLNWLYTLPGVQSSHIVAGDGDDILSTTVGNDVLDGGAGSDTAYIRTLAGVPVDLRLTTAQQTGAGYDTFLSIENLISVGYNAAWLIGDAANNTLYGNYNPYGFYAFNDRLEGGAGDDTLYGRAGNDVLMGGTGNDTLSGDEGDDLLIAGPGVNTAAGGIGVDTLVLAGARFGGTLTTSNGNSQNISGVVLAELQGSYTGSTETTSFTGLENLSFVDGRLVRAPYDPAMQIARLYEAALDRTADPMGLNYWIDVRKAGFAMDQIGDLFAGSAEFASLYGGLDNAGYVTKLFDHVLDRAPDTSSFNTWVNALNSGMSRGSVLSRFSESAEFANRFQNEIQTSVWDQDEGAASIARLYQATLGRHPEEYGLISWRGRMDDGLSLYDIVPGFLNSAEFRAIYGATTNAQFVTLLYNNVLGRGPDAEGFAHWTSRLDQGIEDRVQVVIGFSESYEFRVQTMSWIEGGIVLA